MADTPTLRVELKYQTLKTIIRDAANDDLDFIKKLVKEEESKRGHDVKFVLFDVTTRHISDIRGDKAYSAAIRYAVNIYINQHWAHLTKEQMKNLAEALYMYIYCPDDSSYIEIESKGPRIDYHCKVDIGVDYGDLEDVLRSCLDFVNDYPLSPNTLWFVNVIETLHAEGIETPGIRVETVCIPLGKTYYIDAAGFVRLIDVEE